MNFTSIENIRNHNEWDSVKGFLFGVLKILILVVLIPFLLIGLLFSVFKKGETEKIINDWAEFTSTENLTLERIFIDENELPENLDYPQEANDIYLFQVRSVPEIQELNDKYFDYQFVKVDQGVLLLSFNEKDKGMSIWFVDYKKQKIEKVRDLESSWWNFGNKDGKILLETTLNRKDIKIEIEKTGYNTVYSK